MNVPPINAIGSVFLGLDISPAMYQAQFQPVYAKNIGVNALEKPR